MTEPKITLSLAAAKKLAAVIRRVDDAEIVLPFDEWQAVDKFRKQVRRAVERATPSSSLKAPHSGMEEIAP